ncbi:hypothetical protein Tco_1245056, partial [Tanacetum coccineum]
EDRKFWEDILLNDIALKVKFLRIYALELDKNVNVAEKKKALALSFRRTPRGGLEEEQFKALHSCVSDLLLLQMRDRWVWFLNSSGEFSVKSVRDYIDDILLRKVIVTTRWVKVMPIKDLYDRMGRMKIRQEAIKRMEYRQSYHWDRYAGVFEHMAGVYSVPMQGAYNPPGYAQPPLPQYQ